MNYHRTSSMTSGAHSRTINAYARYEQGRSVPTIQKLSELFAAAMPHRDLVRVESET